jgi:heptosyltransferase-4
MKTKPIIDLTKINSVLFVRLGKLGDMIISSMLINRVRAQFPHLKIGLITLPRSKGLFKYNQDINVLKTWLPVLLPGLALTERIRGWDLLADLNDEPSRRSLLALTLIKPKTSMAFKNAKSEGVFDITIPTLQKEKSHVLERLDVYARALGIDGNKHQLKPFVALKNGSFERTKTVQNKIAGYKGVTVVLNISAGHKSRYWAPEKWEQLAKALLAVSPNVFLRILSAPADEILRLKLLAKLPVGRLMPPAGKALDDFFACIAAGDMLVSPDTSAVHAACAFDIPVLGLYPEPYWNFISWRPLGKKNQAIRSPKEGVDSISAGQGIKAAVKMLKHIIRKA